MKYLRDKDTFLKYKKKLTIRFFTFCFALCTFNTINTFEV